MTTQNPAVSYRDFSVSFGSRQVTRDVSFDLVPGSILALVGESGSGKSVTALAPLGLVPGASEAGSVLLCPEEGATASAGVVASATTASAGAVASAAPGVELVGLDQARLRAIRGERVGVVFQEPMSAFNPMFRVGHQIAEAVRAHTRHPGPDLGDRVVRQLRTVGLHDPEAVARAYPHELSGGQLQRAMIALATINSPQVLIADEPTTALDVTVQTGILDLLLAQAQAGQAVLLITHDMGVVADIADRVAVMKDGRIVESGPVAQIFSDPTSAYTRELLAAVPRLSAVTARRDDSPAEAAAGSRTDAGSEPPTATGPVPAAELSHATVVHRSSGRRVVALDDVSLVVPAGQITGLVGESGSGKSTIANVLTGGQALTSGEAFVDGELVTTRPNRRQRRRRAEVGVVFQDPRGSLNPRRSVGTQIAEPLRVHTDLGSRQIEARVDELLADVQLPTDFAERYPHELSGGQRQRVAIARALALRPKLLIADEPTSALDVSVQRGVLRLLADLHEVREFACLFISHDLAVVEQLASSVVVLRDGRIVEEGSSRQVLTDPQQPYTRELIESAPVPDPAVQAARRAARLAA